MITYIFVHDSFAIMNTNRNRPEIMLKVRLAFYKEELQKYNNFN